MPELPEVETVMRGLRPHMEGAVIAKAELRRADLRFPFPPRFAARLEGARVCGLKRRAKYILAGLSTGETLVMHLGMSGRFVVNGAAFDGGLDEGERHCHLALRLASGDVVGYHDPRRFGYMDLIASDEIERHKYFAALGPEPLGNRFHAAMLAARAKGRKTPLKSFLLDQRVVAGLGNIYVLEALFRAGLSPFKPASILATAGGRPRPVAELLVEAVRSVLLAAIEAGGSTLKDYAKADGSLGYFQHSFQVYGRAGGPCQREGCGGVIERAVQSGRSSFYCPQCQH